MLGVLGVELNCTARAHLRDPSCAEALQDTSESGREMKIGNNVHCAKRENTLNWTRSRWK